MTQPTAVDTTFDTSLIDLHARNDPAHDALHGSFSSTESTVPSEGENTLSHLLEQNLQTTSFAARDQQSHWPGPSTAAGHELYLQTTNARNQQNPSHHIPTRYLPTTSMYNEWASTYDSDESIVRSVDDLEIERFLPVFLDRVQSEREGVIRIADIGCGTGRTTAKLFGQSYRSDSVRITCIDASEGMLSVAKAKLDSRFAALQQTDPALAAKLGTRLLLYDFLDPVDPMRPLTLPSDLHGCVDAVISTLMLEHLPLRAYFLALHALLGAGGIALVTNVHHNVSSMLPAGFEQVNPVTGTNVRARGHSWQHTLSDSILASQECGFELLDLAREGAGAVEGWSHGFREVAVTKEMLETGVVSGKAEEFLGQYVWYGMLLRKV